MGLPSHLWVVPAAILMAEEAIASGLPVRRAAAGVPQGTLVSRRHHTDRGHTNSWTSKLLLIKSMICIFS